MKIGDDEFSNLGFELESSHWAWRRLLDRDWRLLQDNIWLVVGVLRDWREAWWRVSGGWLYLASGHFLTSSCRWSLWWPRQACWRGLRACCRRVSTGHLPGQQFRDFLASNAMRVKDWPTGLEVDSAADHTVSNGLDRLMDLAEYLKLLSTKGKLGALEICHSQSKITHQIKVDERSAWYRELLTL